jgi:hypothetical protein
LNPFVNSYPGIYECNVDSWQIRWKDISEFSDETIMAGLSCSELFEEFTFGWHRFAYIRIVESTPGKVIDDQVIGHALIQPRFPALNTYFLLTGNCPPMVLIKWIG